MNYVRRWWEVLKRELNVVVVVGWKKFSETLIMNGWKQHVMRRRFDFYAIFHSVAPEFIDDGPIAAGQVQKKNPFSKIPAQNYNFSFLLCNTNKLYKPEVILAIFTIL